MLIHRRVLLAQLLAGVSAFALGREALAQNVTYTYDALGRIITASYPNGATITYSYDPAGNRTQVVQVEASPAPTGTFSASPTSISSGGSSTLSWTSSNATSASINNGLGAVTPVAGGSGSVSPTTTTTYTLTLNGAGGQTTLQATVTVTSGTFDQTIQITGTGPVNLRSLADTAGYDGTTNATIIYQVGSAVTILGASGGGIGIDTGTWPSDKTISLTLQVSGKVYGGGGVGAAGAGMSGGSGAPGNGGDAVYCRESMSVTVNAGGEIKAGGGGGGGGGAWHRQVTLEGIPTWVAYNGGGGGGGFPNGAGGAKGSINSEWGLGDVANHGSSGTTSGGAAGGSGGNAGSGRTTGAGGTGGAAAGAGSSGSAATGSENATWVKMPISTGGSPGFAVRKNGETVTVTNNGTVAGTVG